MGQALVSIIMPAYNAQRFIAQAIESVIAQTYPHWELLVVNDGSTDATPRIVEEIAQTDQRVKLINQTNKKLAGARNTALKIAAGQWIALLDADDLWHPQKLERQFETLLQNTQADVVYTSGWVFKDTDLAGLTPYKIEAGAFTGAAMYQQLYKFNTIPVLSVLFKKELIDRVGLQQEEIHCLEDWDYWLRMSLAGANFYGLNEGLFYYRRHGQNMSGNVIDMHTAQALIWIKNYQPEAINLMVFSKAMVSLFNFVLPLLIKDNQTARALYLVEQLQKVLPRYAHVYKRLIKLSNRNTIVFFSLANRLYKKVAGSKPL